MVGQMGHLKLWSLEFILASFLALLSLITCPQDNKTGGLSLVQISLFTGHTIKLW